MVWRVEESLSESHTGLAKEASFPHPRMPLCWCLLILVRACCSVCLNYAFSCIHLVNSCSSLKIQGGTALCGAKRAGATSCASHSCPYPFIYYF